MQSPSKLRVYAHAKTLASQAYQLSAAFPASERFGLVSQVRRAAVSVGANIAEGCGRGTDKALIAFLQISLGSLSELEFLADVSVDLGYCSAKDAEAFKETASFTKAMLCRLIIQLRKRPKDSHSAWQNRTEP